MGWKTLFRKPLMVSMARELTNMPQLEHIEAIEKRLWTAADTLRGQVIFQAS